MTDSRWQRFRHFIGFPASGHHAGEQLVATLGGAIGILLIVVVTQAVVGLQGALIIVPSMGASAVLIFAAPHSPFAQPWAVLAGHVLSALVGVACWQLVPNPTLAAGLAVGLAIGVMHVTRCLHPPAGRTTSSGEHRGCPPCWWSMRSAQAGVHRKNTIVQMYLGACKRRTRGCGRAGARHNAGRRCCRADVWV